MKNLTKERGSVSTRGLTSHKRREKERKCIFLSLWSAGKWAIGPISIEIPYLFLFTAVELGTVSHS